MHNEFITKSFFVVVDEMNNEILQAIVDGIPYWNYVHYNPTPECQYKTKEEAQAQIDHLMIEDAWGEFEIQERFIGDDLYEEIRAALNLCYGDELVEYDKDHSMTEAVMKVIRGRYLNNNWHGNGQGKTDKSFGL